MLARYRKFATALRRVERRWQNRDVTFLLLATRVKPERSRVGILADSQSNHRPIVEIPRKHSDRQNIDHGQTETGSFSHSAVRIKSHTA